jgi:hypothetical protein
MRDAHVKLIQDCHRKSKIPEEVEEDTIPQQIGHNFHPYPANVENMVSS